MANTPTLSLRVPTDLHQTIRDIAAKLKADPGFADVLRAMIGQPPGAAAVSSLPDLRDLARRVEAIERTLHARDAVPAPEPATERPIAVQPQQDATPPPVARSIAALAREKRHRQTVTQEMRQDVLRRRAAGERVTAIAKATGIPQPTVSRIIAKADAASSQAI